MQTIVRDIRVALQGLRQHPTFPLIASLSLVLLSQARLLDAQQPTIVIDDVTIIDAVHASPLPHRTVIVRAGRIDGIQNSVRTRAAAGAIHIDGRGRFLIPGLWDMHTHSQGYTAAARSYPQLLLHGIVGVRDMGTPLDDIVRIRDSLKSGAMVGPHLVFCGPLIQGPLPFSNPLMLQVRSAREIARGADSLASAGVDCLKVHDGLSRDLWALVISAGQRKNLPVVGHLPPSVPALEASEQGQRSIEHLGGRFLGVLLGVSTAETELRATEMALVDSIIAALKKGREPDDMLIYRGPFATKLVETQSRARRQLLLRSFVKHKTWQTPTLVALPVRALLGRSDTSISPRDRLADDRLLQLTNELVREMWRTGVRLLAGTDSPLDNPRLTDELQLLVQAGLPPFAALQAATRNAAMFLNRQHSGTVALGQDADLVLLTANPLKDIRNVDRVETVIFQGRLVRQPPLGR